MAFARIAKATLSRCQNDIVLMIGDAAASQQSAVGNIGANQSTAGTYRYYPVSTRQSLRPDRSQ